MLYQKLLIFADFSEDKFFVPSLLRMLSAKEVSAKRLSLDSQVAPLVLYFPDGPPRRGIFCALVSFLTSPENHYPHPWKLKMPARSVTPDCLHRNCIQFTIPEADTPCCLTVIDTLLQFEVHMDISEPPDPDFCSSIERAISAGLQKANLTLGYTNSTPSFAFLCPCGVGEPHPAKIGKKSWICTLNEVMGKKFSPNHLVWLDVTTTESKRDSQTGDVKGDNNGHTLVVSTSSSKQGSGMEASNSNPSRGKPTPDLHNDGHSTSAAGTSSVPAELTLQGVATQAGIKNLEALDQECCQKVLLSLAKHCVNWQLIGLHLELTDGDITAVDVDNRTMDEKRVGMLRRWKEQFAFKATYLVLIKALLACGRTSDAVHACKAIVSGIGASSEEEVVFSSSMSEEDFFKWLKSRGVSDKDCKTLSDNGVTPSGFIQFDAEDFDDIGLTKFGKKLVIKILAEVRAFSS